MRHFELQIHWSTQMCLVLCKQDLVIVDYMGHRVDREAFHMNSDLIASTMWFPLGRYLRQMSILLFFFFLNTIAAAMMSIFKVTGQGKKLMKVFRNIMFKQAMEFAVSLGDNVCRSNLVLSRQLQHSFKPHQRETGQFHHLLWHDIFEDFDLFFTTCCHFKNGHHWGSNFVEKGNPKN